MSFLRLLTSLYSVYNGMIEDLCTPLLSKELNCAVSVESSCTALSHSERVDNMSFAYKEQYAVVVICEDQKEQEVIYNRLKAEGLKLKVVAV